jgi:hypothetical protein
MQMGLGLLSIASFFWMGCGHGEVEVGVENWGLSIDVSMDMDMGTGTAGMGFGSDFPPEARAAWLKICKRGSVGWHST